MAEVLFRILGETVALPAPDADSPVRPQQTLPFLYQLDDKAIDAAVRHADGEVSCRRGCSACCRAQPVPVTPPEALNLWLLLESMPDDRRSELYSRFQANSRRLHETGLATHFLQRDPSLSRDDARRIARQYFDLALVCPFLESDACSIYEHRPFVCRQYLVTSPAEWCSNPFGNAVQPVRMPLTPATAMLRITSQMLGRPQFTVPLALALDYAREHRVELERRFAAPKLYEAILRTISA